MPEPARCFVEALGTFDLRRMPAAVPNLDFDVRQRPAQHIRMGAGNKPVVSTPDNQRGCLDAWERGMEFRNETRAKPAEIEETTQRLEERGLGPRLTRQRNLGRSQLLGDEREWAAKALRHSIFVPNRFGRVKISPTTASVARRNSKSVSRAAPCQPVDHRQKRRDLLGYHRSTLQCPGARPASYREDGPGRPPLPS